MDIIKILASEFSLRKVQVENVIKLIDEGNTIPFIARYRKEMTGSLDDQILREIYDRLIYLRNFQKRKEEIIAAITEQGKITDEILKSLDNAATLTELEDIYRPFRPKRRTRASIAKEKGLEPLAIKFYSQDIKEDTLEDLALLFVDESKGVSSVEDAITGARDIIAEQISDDAELRKNLRSFVFRSGVIVSKAATEEDSVYSQYYDYNEPVSKIAEHRVLAINRGEKEEFLKVTVEVDKEAALKIITDKILKEGSISTELVSEAAQDSYDRLIFPSIEREIRNELTESAEEAAIKVFALNLKNLLMQPPVKGATVLGIDPAYRTGCKIAVVDDTGKVLDTSVIFPTPPQSKIEESKNVLISLIKKHNVNVIAIGNGTASRETEIFVAESLRNSGEKVAYIIVNEAGASVYSASKLAAEEFPEFDVTLRSAVSIARRLQDPLAELVKIDPKSIGVGQYQHDMKQSRLDETLRGVVEHCVNTVGVDLNTASAALLSYVSGIGPAIAKNIVKYREESGAFKSRKELLKVPKLGPKAFEQCAGFLRVPESKNILDNTNVHPESYDAAVSLLSFMVYELSDIKNGKLQGLKEKLATIGYDKVASQINVGEPTLRDIVEELYKPGRDPRDELSKPVFRTDILDIKDLKPGMELMGTVRNVIDFGAFVDIGVHQDGLVHISQISSKYIKHPGDVLKIGDIVKVKVLSVDVEKMRISLTMRDDEK